MNTPGFPTSLPLVPRLLSWVINRPYKILILAVAVSLALGSFLPRLQIGTSVHDFVIEDLRETAHYTAFKQVFESDEIIRIVLRTDDIFDPKTFACLSQLVQDSTRIAGVRRVISLPGIKKAVEGAGEWPLDRFKALITPVRLFSRNLISADNRATVVTLVLKDGTDSQAVIAAVDRLMAALPSSMKAYQIGMPLVSQALADYTLTDLRRLPPMTFAIIGVILLVLFRNVACLLLPLAVVCLAQVWTFALMAAANVPLTMLTMIVPVFLIAVGTAYSLHLCAGYLHAAPHCASPAEAVSQAFEKLAVPTVLAVATTVVGVAALLLNRIDAIREFAVFACLGMISQLILLFTVFPAALSILPLPPSGASKTAGVGRLAPRLLDRLFQLSLRHRKLSFGATAIVVVFCTIGIFRIQVETNPVGFFKSNTPISRHFHDIYTDLSGSFPMNVLMTGNREDFFEDIDNVRALDQVGSFLESLPGVDKVISFSEYLKLVNYVLNRYDPAYYTLPEEGFELRMLMNNFKTLLGDDTFRRFMSPDLSRTNILMLTHLSSSRGFLDIQNRILDHVRNISPDQIDWQVTGLGVVISASSEQLARGQIKSLSLTLVLVFGIMALLFLSTKVGAVALLPTLLPILVNFGMMGWLGIHLSMATGLIASIAIGLSVDDTIHFLFRYKREFKKDLDKDRTLKDTLHSVGVPVVATSVTIVCGFAILMVSHFKPTALFGLLMVITMSSALAATLVLLPALMLNVELITAWDMLKWIPSLGGVPPGIAHELRQPLNAIKLGSAVVQRMTRSEAGIDPERVKRVVVEIGAQVDRAAAIIDRLTDMGFQPAGETGLVDLADPVYGTLTLMAGEFKLEQIALEIRLGGELPPVKANRHQLAQIVFNLVANARDAILERRAAADSTEPDMIRITGSVENGWVTLAVMDSGIGMPDYVKERAFEPFFSTKGEGQGKGLGLAISHQIVRSYGGRIELMANPERGTTARLRLPAAERRAGGVSTEK